MVLVTDSIVLTILNSFLLPITKEVRVQYVQVNKTLVLMVCITVNLIKL